MAQVALNDAAVQARKERRERLKPIVEAVKEHATYFNSLNRVYTTETTHIARRKDSDAE